MVIEIYNPITDKEIEEVLSDDKVEIKLRRIWGCLNSLSGNIELEKQKLKILSGIHVLFDLRSVIYGEVKKYLNNNQVQIMGCKRGNIFLYWTELEDRIKLGTELLKSMYGQEHYKPMEEGDIEDAEK